MKLKVTFEVDCGDMLINQYIPEEMEWLRDDILVIGGKDWGIVNGEVGDSIGEATLLNWEIIDDKE